MADYIKIIETKGDPPKPERRKAVDDAFHAFWAYFMPRRIYFSRSTAGQIATLQDELFALADEFSLFVEHGPDEHEKTAHWFKAYHQMRDKITPLFGVLEQEFRGLLGVKEVSAGPGPLGPL